MKKILLLSSILFIFLSACGSVETPIPATPTSTLAPPATATVLLATATEAPTATAIALATAVPIDWATASEAEKLAAVPKNSEGLNPDHFFNNSIVVYKDASGVVQKLYDLATGELKTPKEANYVTREEWRNEIFTGTFITEYGGSLNSDIVYSDELNKGVLTDPNEVSKLPDGTPMIILNPSGEVTVWSSTNDAVQKVKDGGTVLLAVNVLPDTLAKFALGVLNREYLAGNKNLYMQFNESPTIGGLQAGIILSIEKYFITELTSDGRFRSPVVRMPKHFQVRMDRNKGDFVDPPQIEDSSEFWIDSIKKSGFQAIFISQN